MSFFSVDELPAADMLPGVTRRAVYLDDTMMTFFDFEPGSVVPEHSHPHEQITYIVKGAMKFTLQDETHVLRAGEGVCCPPDVPHSAVILDEPTVALDAWYPMREDYK
ncbi:MAG TPA: cupin domain-containing protein [Chloroflexi bacterium]|nr:cupin domain-containing protein [Chloroflexota bacterium]